MFEMVFIKSLSFVYVFRMYVFRKQIRQQMKTAKNCATKNDLIFMPVEEGALTAVMVVEI